MITTENYASFNKCHVPFLSKFECDPRSIVSDQKQQINRHDRERIKDIRKIFYYQIRSSQIEQIKHTMRLCSFLQQQIFTSRTRPIQLNHILLSEKASQVIKLFQSELSVIFTQKRLQSTLLMARYCIKSEASLVMLNYLCFQNQQAIQMAVSLHILPILLVSMKQNIRKPAYIEMGVQLLRKMLGNNQNQQFLNKYLYLIQQLVSFLIHEGKFNGHIRLKILHIFRNNSILRYGSSKFIILLLGLRPKESNFALIYIDYILKEGNNFLKTYPIHMIQFLLWSLSLTSNLSLHSATQMKKKIYQMLIQNVTYSHKKLSQNSVISFMNCIMHEIMNCNVRNFKVLLNFLKNLTQNRLQDLFDILGQDKIRQIILGINYQKQNKSFMYLELFAVIVDKVGTNLQKHEKKLQQQGLKEILQFYQEKNKEMKILKQKAKRLQQRVFKIKMQQFV